MAVSPALATASNSASSASTATGPTIPPARLRGPDSVLCAGRLCGPQLLLFVFLKCSPRRPRVGHGRGAFHAFHFTKLDDVGAAGGRKQRARPGPPSEYAGRIRFLCAVAVVVAVVLRSGVGTRH